MLKIVEEGLIEYDKWIYNYVILVLYLNRDYMFKFYIVLQRFKLFSIQYYYVYFVGFFRVFEFLVFVCFFLFRLVVYGSIYYFLIYVYYRYDGLF